MTERARAMDEAELRVAGIDTLNRALGPAETLRFYPSSAVGQPITLRSPEGFTITRVWKRSSSEPGKMKDDATRDNGLDREKFKKLKN